MYPSSVYVARRVPSQGCRAMRHVPSAARQFSGGPGFFPSAPFWGGRGGHPFFVASRGRDVFDHFDEFVNRSIEGFPFGAQPDRRVRGLPQSSRPSWQPKFDVSEVEDAYQLRGELPGVEGKDLEVQFTDANTLIIRGKTISEMSQGIAPRAVEPGQDGDANMTTADDTSNIHPHEKDNDAASAHSESSYVKPSVEDEADAAARENSAQTVTETSTTDNTVQAGQSATSQQPDAEAEQPDQPHYWVSERSTGSFQRTFSFPGRVDADNVSASLRNGILDIVVPKAKAPEARRITVQ